MFGSYDLETEGEHITVVIVRWMFEPAILFCFPTSLWKLSKVYDIIAKTKTDLSEVLRSPRDALELWMH